jgi:hypothetical protein
LNPNHQNLIVTGCPNLTSSGLERLGKQLPFLKIVSSVSLTSMAPPAPTAAELSSAALVAERQEEEQHQARRRRAQQQVDRLTR